MNYLRAIRSGFIVWVLLIITFATLGSIPGIKDPMLQQTIVVAFLIIGYSILGATLYYKKDKNQHGLKLGLVISATALVLDVLITVPFFEIPAGRSYLSFFTSPLLWMLVFINTMTVYIYWVLSVRRQFK
ncbi:DUF5367 family protein [Chryseotalea sanaruensis]|uniref:DUF5367 family protein n=1 Tax=Chryseotalea sanaruensis TaxID=2482724 RepID=UPI000F8C5812|nr:DUF5367 family protein [Chryseotalea sanaruensis]